MRTLKSVNEIKISTAQALARAWVLARTLAQAAARMAERLTPVRVVEKVGSVLIWVSSSEEISWVRAMAWMAAATREMVSSRKEALAGNLCFPCHPSTAQLCIVNS
jgi:2-polyprenyl-6-methoxyphenol hydroxylase-like FAD-dependent oxidoreductase